MMKQTIGLSLVGVNLALLAALALAGMAQPAYGQQLDAPTQQA